MKHAYGGVGVWGGTGGVGGFLSVLYSPPPRRCLSVRGERVSESLSPVLYPDSRMALLPNLVETPRVGEEWGPFDDGYITGDSDFDTQSTDEWSSGPSSVDGQWPPPEEGPEPPSPVLLFPVGCRFVVFRALFLFWRRVRIHAGYAAASRRAWEEWLAGGDF